MTPYQQKFLDHLVRVATQDKALAWWSAKNYAQMDPFQLADLPQVLTAEMRRLKSLQDSGSVTSESER